MGRATLVQAIGTETDQESGEEFALGQLNIDLVPNTSWAVSLVQIADFGTPLTNCAQGLNPVTSIHYRSAIVNGSIELPTESARPVEGDCVSLGGGFNDSEKWDGEGFLYKLSLGQ